MAFDKHHPERDANLDPITHEPGAHPVGTGLGAAAGGMAAGAAGPAGSVVAERPEPHCCCVMRP